MSTYPISCNELQVIEYPGRVKNELKMLDTLGGISKISQVFSGDSKRLELHYHNDNPYNKGACSESNKHYGFLLAIKVRRHKNNRRPPEYSMRVVGHCTQMHSFMSICDFQYIPLCREPNSKLFDASASLIPESVSDAAYFSQSNAPLLTLPAGFAKISSIGPTSAGIFRYDGNEDEMQAVLETLPKYASDAPDVIAFSMTDALPTQPDQKIVNRTKAKYITDEQFQRVKALFDECPIWTRVALLYESKISNDKLKSVVPALAFFYTSGPWRAMYVRYGYDPRKHFESRFYQTFDFRLRIRTGIAAFVAVRADCLRKQQTKEDYEKTSEWEQDVNYPYFSEHKLPRGRQCIMRYCDLHIPKIQEMIEKIPTPHGGAICNEKTGWLPAGFDASVRQIVSNSMRELLRLHKMGDTSGVSQGSDEEEEEEDDDEAMEAQSDDDFDQTNNSFSAEEMQVE